MPAKKKIPALAIIVSAAVVATLGVALLALQAPTRERKACTMEAMLCPDGSAVGRSGPNCEFAPCPREPMPEPGSRPIPPQAPPAPPQPPKPNCTSDKDCADGEACQATEGMGTVTPNGPSTYTIVKGECRKKAGGPCNDDDQCFIGLVCHAHACAEPQNGQCKGPDDKSCPTGYRCVQGCGPPVARADDPPPQWYCEVEELARRPRNCPICLASSVMIATPSGPLSVKDVRVGTVVWTATKDGARAAARVKAVGRTEAPRDHRVVHLRLADGRETWVSPSHPTSDGRIVGDLGAGDLYDGSRVGDAELLPYWDAATYDLLPEGETGSYWADGILLGSTLSR